MSEATTTAPVTTTTAPVTTTTAPVTTEAAPAATGKWTDGLSTDMQDYVTNKGFQSPTSVLESYVNLEKLRGVPDSRLLKIPEKSDDPAWADVYKKLGSPDDAKDYGIKYEGDNADFGDWLANSFKEAGLSVRQGQELVEKLSARDTEAAAGLKQSSEAKAQQQELDLKKEWGQAYHQNIAKAQNAAKEFGMDATAIDALESVMGYDGVMKFMNSIGSKIGEDTFVQGGKTSLGGLMTPEQAQSRIQALKGDSSFTKRFLGGDLDAKTEMDNLHKQAYGN